MFVTRVQWILFPNLLLCFSGYAFKPSETTWPVTELKERRKEQNSLNESLAMSATEGLTYSEDEIPVVCDNNVK